MTSRQSRWCSKQVMWELNSFLIYTFSFVSINLYAETVSAASVTATEFVLLVESWSEEGEVMGSIRERGWSILRL